MVKYPVYKCNTDRFGSKTGVSALLVASDKPPVQSQTSSSFKHDDINFVKAVLSFFYSSNE